MAFSTSTLGTVLEAGKTELTQQTPDIVLWMLGVFGVTLIIGIVYAAFNRARKQTVAAVGGGSRRRR
jgi:hypothetical protein